MPESSAAVPASNTPSDTAVLYHEKLWPNVWIWLVAAGLSGAGILVFAPISMAAGITAAVVLFVIIAVLLVVSTPAITVTGSTLRVKSTSTTRTRGHAEATASISLRSFSRGTSAGSSPSRAANSR